MIGEAIHQMRKRQGLTLDFLAEKSGVHQTTLSRYERGQREPRLKAVQSIADALGVTVEDIMSLAKALEYAESEEGAEYVPAVTQGTDGDQSKPFNLERWRVLASLAKMDWRAKLLLGLLPAFLDRESGVVAITREQAITRGHLDADFVDAAFPVVLESGFVERIGEVEYLFRLRFPAEPAEEEP